MTQLIRRIAFYLCSSNIFSLLGFAQARDVSARFTAAFLAFSFTAAAQPTHWVASWAASPAPPLSDPAALRSEGLEFDNETVREIVHLSIGGPVLRVRFSNLFGGQSLEIVGAHIALRAQDSAIAASSDRRLTFGGAPGISIPANAVVYSDLVKLDVPAGSDLAVSIFLSHTTLASGIHYFAHQTSYVGPGDLTAAPSLKQPRKISSWVFLAGVDVSAPPEVAAPRRRPSRAAARRARAGAPDLR